MDIKSKEYIPSLVVKPIEDLRYKLVRNSENNQARWMYNDYRFLY